MNLDKRQINFLDTLKNSLGILTLALQQTGVKREDYEDWMEDITFKVEVDKINEMSLDFVENQLMKEIKDGNVNAISFYLKTKGKNRGY
jgi:hypothetical protein